MERFITIEEDIIYKEDYQMKMLRNNKIIGLIPMRGMGVNDKSQYLYEIGGKISLTGLYERGRVTCDDIESLLSNILLIMHETEEYLLDLSRIYFKPEYIFWGDNRFYFCYYPLKKNVLWEEFQIGRAHV